MKEELELSLSGGRDSYQSSSDDDDDTLSYFAALAED